MEVEKDIKTKHICIYSMPTYQQNKASIYRWRIKNPEQHKANLRKSMQKHYYWNKIKKEFLNILLDA
jgi:hypothetical protein